MLFLKVFVGFNDNETNVSNGEWDSDIEFDL